LRFFVGQPRTGGYGITLTEANTVIYFSNSYDLEIRLQSEDRAHRIGQKDNVTYVDLVSPGTIDEKILTALRDKINIAGDVLGESAKNWLI
jgi:SNF2 family DNA or RNA helicase